MPAPSVTIWSPPPNDFLDPLNLRPQTRITWTGGTGPFDVVHEWDTDIGFGSPITDTNVGATSPETGVPPSDMGPAGTTWYYRATVTDTDDAAFTTTGTEVLDWTDVMNTRRHLFLLANVGFGISPIDDPAPDWGPDPDPAGGGPDGFAIDARRHLFLLGNVGVAFDPTDGTSWATTPPDGFIIEFNRYLYLLANVGVGFDPTDGTSWATVPPDGYTIEFNRYLYLLANIEATTPTPHIWYLYPTFGREGWEFKIVGYGFGDTQGTHTGTARLNALAVGIISWAAFAEVGSGLEIDPLIDLANPIHQEIRATVPTGGESGLVFVETDDV